MTRDVSPDAVALLEMSVALNRSLEEDLIAAEGDGPHSPAVAEVIAATAHRADGLRQLLALLRMATSITVTFETPALKETDR